VIEESIMGTPSRQFFNKQFLTFILASLLVALMPQLGWAQGFDKINTTVTNVNTILVTISIAVVTIAIIWAGFKMIFQGARLADVANILIGGTLIGGATAFSTYIVS
jgi:type IV secretion system protein VirB2